MTELWNENDKGKERYTFRTHTNKNLTYIWLVLSRRWEIDKRSDLWYTLVW